MYILANITKQFKPLKDKHPIFDEDGDDDQDNPFKQGSLLANMRESTESYQIEASFKHRGEVKRDENVVKKLDFDGKDGKKGKYLDERNTIASYHLDANVCFLPHLRAKLISN